MEAKEQVVDALRVVLDIFEKHTSLKQMDAEWPRGSVFGIVLAAYEKAQQEKQQATWSNCCRVAGRLADLVCLMYHPKDEMARKVWPTATWSEIIASELGIEVPETE
jgi:hypothetical protein